MRQLFEIRGDPDRARVRKGFSAYILNICIITDNNQKNTEQGGVK